MKKTWLEYMEENPDKKTVLLKLKCLCLDICIEQAENEYELKLKQSKL